MVLTVHTLVVALLVGLNTGNDVLLLGVAPGVPRVRLKRLCGLMWLGFWLHVVSGALLVISYPTKQPTNRVLYSKLLLIMLAILILRKIRFRAFGDLKLADEAIIGQCRNLAVLSLCL